MSSVPAAQVSPVHLESPASPSPDRGAETAEALLISGLCCVYIWSRHFLVLCLGFQPSPWLFPCCHGEYNTKLHSRPSSYYSFAFPFPSNIIDIIDNPSISRPYHNVHLAPKAEVAQLYILITPTPRSNGYALTLGYNEGSGGSVLV